MPIYEYECPDCGPFERVQAISAKPLRSCPTCGRRVRKLVSSSSFRLKGGGWFADGYSASKGGDGGNGGGSAEGKTKPAESGDSKKETGASGEKPASETKPIAKKVAGSGTATTGS